MVPTTTTVYVPSQQVINEYSLNTKFDYRAYDDGRFYDVVREMAFFRKQPKKEHGK